MSDEQNKSSPDAPKKRRGRPPKSDGPIPNSRQNKFEFSDLSDEGKSFVAAAARAKRKEEAQWRGKIAIPPASLLEKIINEFEAKTEIPLEIPFFTFLHYLAAHLVVQDTVLNFYDDKIRMNFWTVVLATSGEGKSYVHKKLRDSLGDIPEIDGTAQVSSAAFIQELKRHDGKGLWLRDEMLQWIRAIEMPGPQADMKDIMLRAYDGQTIARESKTGGRIEVIPRFSFLGFNVLETFVDGINPESMIDGFAQRFSYVVAKEDPKRQMKDFPWWKVDSSGWEAIWKGLVTNICTEFVSSEASSAAFETCFQEFINVDIPKSFYRRLMMMAHKYAVLYHVIRGEGSNPNITAEDYGWAARIIGMHMSDLGLILSKTQFGDLEKILQSCERVVADLKKKGMPITPRVLLQRVKALKNAGTADWVFKHLNVV
jgi:hypothetical protein